MGSWEVVSFLVLFFLYNHNVSYSFKTEIVAFGKILLIIKVVHQSQLPW